MSLAKTRTTRYTTTDFAEPGPLTYGQGAVTIEIDWWDAPVGDVALMLRREMVQTRPDGVIVQRVIERWDYDGPIIMDQAPTRYAREVHARVYLPGVNWRERLQCVERTETTYTWATEWVPGPMASRTRTAGYAIYDLAAENWDASTPTADGTTAGAKLAARGQRPPAGPMRLMPDSARSWRTAVQQFAIVEEPTANQLAVWVDPLEEIRDDVEVDAQVIRRWRTRHDYLTGLTEVDGPQEERRPDVAATLPFSVRPPTVTASDARTEGVRVEIRGGGAEIEQWVGEMAPVKRVQRIAPEEYVVWRRVVARGPKTPTGDRFAIRAAPVGVPEGWPRTRLLESVDYGGAPAEPLPPAGPDEEPDAPVYEEPVVWAEIGRVANQSAHAAAGEGFAVMFDRDVDAGWTYAYYAVAAIGDQMSAESNEAECAYSGPRATRSTVAVRTVTSEGGDIVIDIDLPPDPLLQAMGLPPEIADGYGEVMQLTVPARVERAGGETVAIDGSAGYGAGNAAAWPTGLLTDAVDLARAIGLRHGMRNRDRDLIRLTLTAPLLGIERGQRVSLPAVEWETVGSGVRMRAETRLAEAPWMVEGMTIALVRTGPAAFTVDATLEVEEA